jgi:peptide/nickel transport system substrate-binding protein
MNDELKYLAGRAAQGRVSRRAFMGRAAALGVGAGMASNMLASAVSAQGAVKGGMLRAGLQGGESTNTLDPALAASEVPAEVNYAWGEPLVEVGIDGSLEPRLASDISSSPDAKSWSFKVRSGVTFSNGKSLTADDIKATIERHTDENSQSGALGIVQGIESIDVSGDMVTLNLHTPNADLPYLMADYHLLIQPNGGKDDPTAGIGTGPYTVEINEPGVRHAFKKNPNYWDSDYGHADEVEILVINDNTARIAALQSGQVDMINRVDPKVVNLLRRDANVQIKNVAGRGHYVFIMHCNAEPFANNDMRMALKYAINRQEMVDKILGGLGTAGNDFPINAAYPLFDAGIEQREYDPDKAAFHYKASGHDGSPIILRAANAAFPGAVEAAQLFQQSAAAAGIPLELKREPDDGYWDNVWNVEPFCASYWSGRPVQDQMYSTAYLSTADWNDTKFYNDKFDNLLLAARAELNQTVRKQMYSDMAHILRDEGGLILPMFNDFVDAIGPRVAGWTDNPNGEMMSSRALYSCWVA